MAPSVGIRKGVLHFRLATKRILAPGCCAIDLTKRFESTFKDLGDNEEQGQDDDYGKPEAFLSDPLMSLGKTIDSFIMNG